MTINKEKILKRIDEVLALTKKAGSRAQDYNFENLEKSTLGALTILKITYGSESRQETFLIDLRKTFYATQSNGDRWNLMNYIDSCLETLKTEIELGFIESIEKKAFGEAYGDLLTMSKELIDNNHKEAAVVLACAALEDSLKKFSQYHGLDAYDNDLSKVINSLKSSSLLKGPQAGLVQSYVPLRNKAFHAQFDKIEVPEVKSLIAFVEGFILENFK